MKGLVPKFHTKCLDWAQCNYKTNITERVREKKSANSVQHFLIVQNYIRKVWVDYLWPFFLLNQNKWEVLGIKFGNTDIKIRYFLSFLDSRHENDAALCSIVAISWYNQFHFCHIGFIGMRGTVDDTFTTYIFFGIQDKAWKYAIRIW